MKLYLTLPVIAVLLFAFTIFAGEKVDENALFSDTASIVDSSKVVNTKAAKTGAEEKNSLAFSGQAFAYADPTLTRSWFTKPNSQGVLFNSRVVGNGYIDARLVGGAKAFADIQGYYVPTPSFSSLDPSLGLKPDSGMVFDMPEFFVDANIGQIVHLRAGRQVLQWGPCNFWHPTDMVNIEQKTFLQKEGDRDGTYGLKIHIDYKTLFNFYSFIDANNATSVDSLAVAAKAEFLIGRTELALSTWGKEGKKPVFGIDGTSRLFDIQIAGEVSIRNGADMMALDTSFKNVIRLDNRWHPRIVLGLTKFIPLAGVPDRLTISVEGYFNQAGSDTNLFNNPTVVRYLQQSSQPSDSAQLAQLKMDVMQMPWLANPSSFLQLYEANSYSKYYAAFFASISRFILDDMTFSCNAIANLQQKCCIVSTGISYQSLHNFVLGISLNGYLGPKNTEYTFAGNGLTVQVKTGVIF
jgi:hypothetical protein